MGSKKPYVDDVKIFRPEEFKKVVPDHPDVHLRVPFAELLAKVVLEPPDVPGAMFGFEMDDRDPEITTETPKAASRNASSRTP